MGAISARGLSKTFSAKVKPEGLAASLRSLVKPERRLVEAVRGVSFEVERGEAVAFLGPNGAGKSTTIKTMMGFMFPASGSVRVFGRPAGTVRLSDGRPLSPASWPAG